MRRLVFWLGVLCSFYLMGSLPGAVASADTLSVDQTITVRAVVAPERHIIVDYSGRIVSIISNTGINVTPDVHRTSLHGSNVKLTPPLLKEYNKLLAMHVGSTIGELYHYQLPPLQAASSTLSILKISPLF